MESQEEAILVSGQQETNDWNLQKKHENWTPDDWGKIVWSDESNFEVS